MNTNDSSKEAGWLELFLLSMLSLYLELMVIRWLAADFRAFTVFKTFPLATCFVGIGFGYALADKKYFRWAPWALVLFVAIVQLAEYFGFWIWPFPSFSVYSWQDTMYSGTALWVYVAQFIAWLLLVLSGPFLLMVALGSKLGDMFNRLDPLKAYCVNIGGSIAGSLLYSAVAFLGWAPWLALAPAAVLLCVYAPQAKITYKIAPAVLTILLAMINVDPSPDVVTRWSPYQRLDTWPFLLSDPNRKEPLPANWGSTISSNGHFFLHAIGLSEADLNRTDISPKLKESLQEHARNYNFPYKIVKPKTVLILGAGAGNDVAAALRNGASHVDAVDIDPVIIDLGKKLHPEHPYSDPRVSVICNDARDFLNNTKSRYDLIIIAGLDSQTVTGKGSAVRLDNYVYTRESVESALKLLTKEGLLVLSFCKSRDYISDRMFHTVTAAAGFPPVVVSDTTSPELRWQIYLTGPVMRNPDAVPADILPFAKVAPPTEPPSRLLTDDWPFVYVSPVTLDIPYLLVVGIIVALSAAATRKVLVKEASWLNGQMFFLGAAFLLLELQSIARLSLVYGSTWLTSSIVINGVLLMILGANLLVIKAEKLNYKSPWLFVLLFASLAASYFLPFRDILAWDNWWVSHLLVTVVTLLPMFAAGLIFATAFRNSTRPASALAFNLLGAVIGALVEYMSNYVGISGLVLIAAAFYFCGFLCNLRSSSSVAVANPE